MQNILNLLLNGLFRTGLSLTLSAIIIVIMLSKLNSVELSYFTIVGMTFGLLGLGDVGIGPTIIREIIRNTEKDDSLKNIILQIKFLYKKINIIILIVIIITSMTLKFIYSWDNYYLFLSIAWLIVAPLTLQYSWQDILLNVKKRVVDSQMAMVIQKAMTLGVLLVGAYFEDMTGHILIWYVVSLYLGLLGKILYNNIVNFKIYNWSASESKLNITEVVRKSIPFGVYYICSLLVSKLVFYYLNSTQYEKLDDINIAEKFLSYISVVGNIATTYLMPEHIHKSKSQKSNKYMYVSIIFMILLFTIFTLFSTLFLEIRQYYDEIIFLILLYFIFDETIKVRNSFLYGGNDSSFIVNHVFVLFFQLSWLLIVSLMNIDLTKLVSLTALFAIYLMVYGFKIYKK